MWWYALQGGVIIAVAFHAIYFEWNQNGYAVGAVGIGAAYCATWLVGWLLLKFPRHQKRPDHSVTTNFPLGVGRDKRGQIGGRSGRP